MITKDTIGRALMVGANGQDGGYLVEECKRAGIVPTGISRSGSWERLDCADFGTVEAIVRERQPSYIFHLAANSTTRHEALFENQETIHRGVLNLLEAARRHSPETKVFITGSGLQFVNRGAPIIETDPFEASSAYALARIQSVYSARYYRSLGLRVYVGYLFHHESPRRGPRHVSQMIAAAVRRIAEGSDEMIEIGDMSVRKEWTFAGDVVRGILTLVKQDKIFEAVIGSGEPHSIEEWVEICFRQIGRDWRNHVRTRESFASEYPLLVCDPKTIHSLGWRPTTNLEALAKMMLAPG